VTYRCAIRELRYGLGDGPVDKIFKLPPCDPADPNSTPENATLYIRCHRRPHRCRCSSPMSTAASPRRGASTPRN